MIIIFYTQKQKMRWKTAFLIIYVKRFNEVIEKIEKYIIEIDYRDKYKFKSRIENVKKYHEDYRKSSTVEEFIENNKDYLV